MNLDRREALGLCVGAAVAWSGAPGVAAKNNEAPDEIPAREASWYKKLDHLKVECGLCPQGCSVADGERGTCGVRENRKGTYYTLVHGAVCALHLDPVEKKPFFHVLPGRNALSYATAGCNVACVFCQNWEISQFRPEQVPSRHIEPRDMVEIARREGASMTAATYSEPTVFWEYVRDVAAASRKAGIHPLVVSNGYIKPEPLSDVLPLLAAYKVDLKAMTEDFYVRQVRGHLKPVLETLETIRKSGTWLEIVVLLIPGLNDSEDEARKLARWVTANLGPDVPVHFTRFHPTYLLKNLPPTPLPTLERAWDAAKAEGLHFAYLGNVPGHPGENTVCPGCGAVVIRRVGFSVLADRLKEGKCPDCGREIPGVWS